MKYLQILAIAAIAITLFQCKDDNEQETTENKISFDTSEAGGCNSQQVDTKRTLITESDTVSFSINEGKLNIFVGLNYLCCAPFADTAKIENDTIILTITDNCNDGNYCRCTCFYTWNFYFKDFEEKTYNYKIILNDPQADEPIIFREGTINLAQPISLRLSSKNANSHCKLITTSLF